jgi:hypothetical protein
MHHVEPISLSVARGRLKWLYYKALTSFDEIASASSAKNLKIRIRESSRLLWVAHRLSFGGIDKNFKVWLNKLDLGCW